MKDKKDLKKDQELYNPCLKEHNLTNKCFLEKNFDKEACSLEITNYKVCRSFWNAVQSERRIKGIKPILPPVEEREQIKKEYFKKYSMK